ncbi:MAG: amidohydrolase [Chloroflexota bacterium]|nr:amidohydrolase [Chloroflexota bacterium]
MTRTTSPIMLEAQALESQLVNWRRDLHRHPELAFEEHRTAGVIARYLADLGLEVRTGVGRTGVVGLLAGESGGPCVMLRFDMDALPVEEATGLPFASTIPGRMHACGHDGHVAIGLGVATLLARLKNDFFGSVKLVFQPAEEIAGGARAMIADGALEEPVPDVTFALHLWSQSPSGMAMIKAGPLWASADRFDIDIVGRGSHGAMPHTGVDAVAVTAYAITQLQSIVSRDRDPLQPVVLTIGTVAGGAAFNVLAERVHLSGTLRSFESDVRSKVIERMYRVLAGVCEAHGAQYDLRFSDYTPPVINDPEATRYLRQAARAAIGDEAVIEAPMMMVAEDMAEFINRIPGSYFVIGAQKVGSASEPHHSSLFDIDEAALPVGVAIMVQATLDFLAHPFEEG